MISGFGIIAFLFRNMLSDANIEMMLLMLPFIFWVWAGYYNFTINKKNYILLDGRMITIHRAPLVPKVIFSIKDIDMATKAGNKIRIGLVTGKEVEIRLDSVSVFDIDELYNLLNV